MDILDEHVIKEMTDEEILENKYKQVHGLEVQFLEFLVSEQVINAFQRELLMHALQTARVNDYKISLYEVIIHEQIISDRELSIWFSKFFSGYYVDKLEEVSIDVFVRELKVNDILENRLMPVVKDFKVSKARVMDSSPTKDNVITKSGYMIVDPFKVNVWTLIEETWIGRRPEYILIFCNGHQFDRFVNHNRSTLFDTGIKSKDDIRVLLESLILDAINMRASDIRIFNDSEGGKITFRIDGDLVEYKRLDSNALSRLCDLIADPNYTIVNDTNKNVPRQGKMEITLNGNVYELRVNLMPTTNGIDTNLRFMYKDNFLLENLGATKPREDMLRDICSKRNGLILFCGATGSGKSSTAYAMLDRMKDGSTICTAEDPVEHRMPGIAQVMINESVTYSDAIASFLRHDPDVIFIGEIRTSEVASSAFRATLTGHTVISSIHTTSATGAISRLRDLGISDSDIAECLRYVIYQRLCKRVCKNCATQVIMTRFELAEALNLDFNTNLLDKEEYSVYSESKCTYCNNTGSYGRCLLTEILELDDEVKDMIVYGESAYGIQQVANGKTLHPIIEVIIHHLLDGTISIEEAKRCIRGIHK